MCTWRDKSTFSCIILVHYWLWKIQFWITSVALTHVDVYFKSFSWTITNWWVERHCQPLFTLILVVFSAYSMKYKLSLCLSVSSACGQMDSVFSLAVRWQVNQCAASWRSSSPWRLSSASWTWRTSPSRTTRQSSPNHRATTTSATTSARRSNRVCASVCECVNIRVWVCVRVCVRGESWRVHPCT